MIAGDSVHFRFGPDRKWRLGEVLSLGRAGTEFAEVVEVKSAATGDVYYVPTTDARLGGPFS